jgi:chromosomal replication initiation ATPase DnaA
VSSDDGMRQLPLHLEHVPRLGIEDYLVGGFNEEAHLLVRSWPSWPAPCLLLVGPEGAGKTHLSAIWAAQADAAQLLGAALTEGDLDAVQAGRAFALDDAEAADEVLLFHVINLVRERGAHLLLTARHGPGAHWPKLPDLASRLRAMPRAEIHPPDETILRAVLVKLLDDRQLQVEASVLDYLARHLDRSIGAARAVVAELDREALARGHKVGRRLAGEILARFGGLEPD